MAWDGRAIPLEPTTHLHDPGVPLIMIDAQSTSMITIMELAEKYDVPVPRYTSYPTAPNFSTSVDDQQYREWLRELPNENPISLYIHIPFCDEMCWFCGCYTKVVRRYAPIATYLEALYAEIRLVSGYPSRPIPVRQLHVGGGSPSVLLATDWQRLMNTLHEYFDLTNISEVAVEIDPRDIKEGYIGSLAQSGVTRVSIGIQDFDLAVQQAINRVQPLSIVEDVVSSLRQHNINAINIDLMYGLPGQTVDTVQAMINHTIRLAPSRVALFGYAHVPWIRRHQRMINAAELPNAANRIAQLIVGTHALCRAGYQSIGLDHFAQPGDQLSVALEEGRLRRNFQGYSSDESATVLGLGASAISSLPQGYAQNVVPLAAYRRVVTAGCLPVARGVKVTKNDRLRREVIEQLMCLMEVNLADLCDKYGVDTALFSEEQLALAAMATDGLVDLTENRVRVTNLGRPFVRIIAAVFDAHLSLRAGMHSRAV
jgi:oxygen-independent coproporphyrinogen III oxidase